MRRHYVPGTTVALLSEPSKMPCPSWSLPARASCPWKLEGEGTICGGCYATKGRYVMVNVAAAQAARFGWTRTSLRTADGTAAWVRTMARAIAETGCSYFRIHDSGDFFSPAYVRAWAEVAGLCPEVRFWAPTRSWRAPQPEWQETLRELAALPNVTVRPSALRFDEEPPRVEGLAAGTTARREGYTCPARSQGNACGTCRACWDRPEHTVSYHAS